MHIFDRACVFSLVAILIVAPFVASATEIVTTKEYVDQTTVQKYQGTTENDVTTLHTGDILQVNATGNLERVTPASAPASGSVVPITAGGVYTAVNGKEDTSNKLDGSTNNTIADYPTNDTKYISAKAVAGYSIQKPVSATAGQVLTYGTGATADSRPVAQYLTVPVAAGDPNDANNPSTPTGFASVWIE